MIFDTFISKKSSTLLHKLDKDVKDSLKIFYTLEDSYRMKLMFLKRCKEHSKRDKGAVRGAQARLREINKLLRIIGFEEKADKTEDRYSSKALDILRELLERWKSNKKLVQLTYQEYADLNILHESLRRFVSILHSQRMWLKKHTSNSLSTKNFSGFQELLKQEGILIGKQKEFLEMLKGKTKQVEEEFHREFTYSLIGYGSLMNADETMSELKSTLEKIGTPIKDINAEFNRRVTPVWVAGFKRVFNKIATRKKWETNEDIKANRTAVLNVVASMDSKFNAVAIKLTDDEYKAIREREKNYGVIPLKYVYDYRTGQRLHETCICVKSSSLQVDVPIDKQERLNFYANRIRKFAYGLDPDRLIKSNKAPIPRYIEVIDIGVKKLDSLLGTVGMYDNYLNSTFCYYIDRTARRDYGEIKLIDYYRLIGKEIERRLQLHVI